MRCLVAAAAALAALAVAGPAAAGDCDPGKTVHVAAPAGLRALLVDDGYTLTDATRIDGTLVFGASRKRDHRARLALKLGSELAATFGAVALQTGADERQQLERKWARCAKRPVRITRVQSWHRYVVIDVRRR